MNLNFGRNRKLFCKTGPRCELLGGVFGFQFIGGVTGQQRMLTSPRHMILPSYLSEVRVALHSIL
jgi:hypothetical protein